MFMLVFLSQQLKRNDINAKAITVFSSIVGLYVLLAEMNSDVQNTLKKYFEITKIKYSYKVF